MPEKNITVVFAGNPNCGKTTLFNAFTGARLKTGNWPGVTVEKKEGTAHSDDCTCKLTDLPGIYSLTSYTIEERVSREYILSSEADVIVDVADASSPERSLYLTLQLAELGKPMVLALNMTDIAAKHGIKINTARLSEMLGIPVMPVSARKRTGLAELLRTAVHCADGISAHNTEFKHTAGMRRRSVRNNCAITYSDETESIIAVLSERLSKKYKDINNLRWYCVKYLEEDEEIIKKYPIITEDIIKRSYEDDIINQKYDYIERIKKETITSKERRNTATDKLDKLLTHKILALPLFLCIMAAVFFLTFTVGNFLKGYLETQLGIFSDTVKNLMLSAHIGKFVISLICDGIIAGVGSVLTFLPNIFILFLALAFLEDSGYMSRAAYVMDGIMGSVGLSGRAFIPMLLGFGCTVPAVMAARTLENRKDRLKTIMVLPFMSCSARLPVYVLMSQMFFGKYAMLAAYSMYLTGIITAVAVEFILGKTDKGGFCENNLIIELPEYRIPSARTVAIYVWEKLKDYLLKAGTTIFIASILLWILLNFNLNGMTSEMSESFAALIGRKICILLEPAGLGQWQTSVALISGIAAKEVVVSSMGVLFGIGSVSSADGMNTLCSALKSIGFTAVNAYSMMLFCLLYVPCAASVAVIKRETGSIKFTLACICMQLGIAWSVSTLFYQLASRMIG